MARRISVEIVGDTRSLERAFKRAEKSADGFVSRVGAGLAKVGKQAAVAGVAIGAGLALGAKHAISAASDLNESTNAVNVTFGKASKTVQAFTADAAKLGLSANEANELMTPLGATLQNYGQSADEAAQNSIMLTKRAADMASVFNTSVPEALQAIQAGLRGESDPLERFGVGLSDARVRAEAVRLGLAKTTAGVTDNAKQQARLSLIMSQTNKVQGDFASTSGGVANAMRIAHAQIENASAAIGKALLPIVAKAATGFSTLVQKAAPLIERAMPAIATVFQKVAQIAQQVWPTVQRVVVGAWQFIQANVFPVVRKLAGIVTDAFKRIVAVIRQHRPELERIAGRLGALFKVFAAVAVPIIRFVFVQVLPRAIAIAITVMDKFQGVIEKVVKVLVVLFSKALAGISGFLKGVGALASIGRRLHIPGFEGIEKGANSARGAIDRLREVVRGIGKDGISAGKGLESVGAAFTKTGKKLKERQKKRAGAQDIPGLPELPGLPKAAVPKKPKAKAKAPKVPKIPKAAKPRVPSLAGAHVGTVTMTAKVVNLNADRVVMKGDAATSGLGKQKPPAFTNPGGGSRFIGGGGPVSPFPVRPLNITFDVDGDTVANAVVDPLRTLESRTPYMRRGRFAGSGLTAA